MELGIIGLGRMGGNISQRLMRAGHRTVVYDRNEAAVHSLADKGAAPSSGLKPTWSRSSRRRVPCG